MAPKKASGEKGGALTGFVSVESIPPATRSSWATRVLAQFLEETDRIIACKFDSDKVAISKQASLNKAVQSEAYKGKAKIHRRGDTIYIEKL